MLALAIPALGALALVAARGGWPELRIRWWALALVALAIQIPLYAAPVGDWLPIGVVGPAGTIVTTGLVLVMLLRNAAGPARFPALLVAGGVALNLAVIVLNGGFMPRQDALAPRPLGETSGAMRNTVPAEADTRLAWLGDTLVEPAWLPLANLVSPGDVLLSVGAAAWVLAANRRRAVLSSETAA